MLHHKLYRDAHALADVTGFAWPVEIERYLLRALSRPRERRHRSAAEALADWQGACIAARARGWTAPEPFTSSGRDDRGRTKPA
jgi:hypothetical protein